MTYTTKPSADKSKTDITGLAYRRYPGCKNVFESFATISYLAPIYSLQPESVRSLLGMKDNNGNIRFDSSEVKTLITSYLKFPNDVTELANMMAENGNRNRFNGYQIQRLLPYYIMNKDSFNEIISMKNEKGEFVHDTDSFIKLVQTCQANPRAVLNILYPRKED